MDAVARRVVELLREEGVVSREGPRLLTVAAVSQEFGVSTDWVYANAGRAWRDPARIGPAGATAL